MELEKLNVYQIARGLSSIGWDVYRGMKNENRFSIGQQFLRSIDAIGANIAEGYGRYHYLDSAKFYYNARGSLWEAKHWTSLLQERKLIDKGTYADLNGRLEVLGVKLNNFISAIKAKANNS